MARSFRQVSPANMVEDFLRNNSFHHRASGSYFTMLKRGGEYFQRRHQLSPAGQEINVMEKRIDYVMGSGNHARTYLHRTAANELIELPLGWFAEKGGIWAMNPGYDRPDHDEFQRRITYDCMFCHNAYPGPQTVKRSSDASPVYEGPLPEGIDCQRCHGPGGRHIRLAGSPGAKKEDIRGAIVNPARLSAERQMETCMVCHLQTTSFPLPAALQRHGRGAFSWQPGEPLSGFLLNFDHAPGTGREDKFEIVSSFYRLRRSACYTESAGKMLCTTCHNPHDVPRGQAAATHYTAVCRQCHGEAFHRLVATGRHTSQQDCVGCHMPKRRTEDVVHAAVTDHFIQRQPPSTDLLAELPERHETGESAYRGPVHLYYPAKLSRTEANVLDVAVAQVKQASNLKPGIAQLTKALAQHPSAPAAYYLELADALLKDGDVPKAVTFYRTGLKRDPASVSGRKKLAAALRRLNQPREAVALLERATVLSPRDAGAWHELALSYQALGQSASAMAAMDKAVQLDPDLPEAHNNRGILLAGAGQTTPAEAAFREAIRINPAYVDAQGNLAGLLVARGNPAEAKQHYEIALRFRPRDAPLRYGYAMALGRGGDYEGAQRELEVILGANPEFAEAHELLGRLLLARGRTRDAVAHYRTLLRLRPGSAKARLGLATALASANEFEEAVRLLNEVRKSSDSSAREDAERILSEIGKDR